MLRKLTSAVLALFCMAFTVQPVLADGPLDLGPGRQPQLAIASDGDVFIVYGIDNSIRVMRSTDGGRSFSPSVLVAQVKTTPLGMRRGPRIVATKNALTIAAVVGEQGGGKDGDILCWRSTDHGSTWSGPERISTPDGAAREGLIGLVSDGDRRISCVWLDLRSTGTKIYGAFSSDQGRTFAENVLVYRSPDGHVCECCHPSVAFDRGGNLFVMFRNFIDGNRDLYLTRSSDDARTFAPATRLGEGSWKLNACPMDGGGIVASQNGDIVTAWQRSGRIYRAGTTGAEQFLGDGTQPSIAMTSTAPVIAWTDPAGKLLLQRGAEAPDQLSGSAVDPVLASDGKSNVICAWENHGRVYSVRLDAR